MREYGRICIFLMSIGDIPEHIPAGKDSCNTMNSNNLRTIYHGSDHIIELPVLGGGRAGNDYGPGFYCNELPDLAREWACLSQDGGFLNTYTINDSDLNIVDLTGPDYNPLNWIALLLNNREIRLSSAIEEDGRQFLLDNYLPDISGADIIIGHRADDSFFSFARAFLSNTLSYRQLSQVLYYGDLGRQYVLVSSRAFGRIEFIESEAVNGQLYYSKRKNRDHQARVKYRELVRKLDLDGLFLSRIMQEGINDECLQ